GALCLPALLPVSVLYLLSACDTPAAGLLQWPPPLPGPAQLWHPHALAAALGWLALQGALYLLPLGKVAEGMVLRDGSRLRYPINGFHALCISAALLGLAVWAGLPLGSLYELLLPLAACAAGLSFLLSLLLYLKALAAPSQALAPGGNTGNALYDFFMGHELNPRIGRFDLKYFCELRPGLIGWVVINAAMLMKEAELRGSPSLAMLLVNGFQLLYVTDALWNEVRGGRDMGETGKMGPRKGWGGGSLCGAPRCRGVEFRRFCTDADLPPPLHPVGLETIATATGKRLLVSGWWGFVRHPNYLGDLLMALAWSLPCGVGHLLPYFYVLYFAALLVHREARDERQCLRKYGLAWETYCRRVPYRIVPYLY
ncbi:ERG24 reductase, partial [Atractosteus spatula]|nr:ERG24 reductase [Atractosteus spatula]